MGNIYKITDIEVVPPYGLRISFEDGVTNVVDLADRLWGPAFEPLKDPDYFGRVRVHPDVPNVVFWPNGADLSPETCRGNNPLYRRSESVVG